MITGLRNFVLPLLLLLPGWAHAEPLLDAVFKQLAQGDNHSVNYREHKYLAMLDLPLTQEGHMQWQPPATLIRQQTRPSPQTFTIDHDQITVDNNGQRQQLPLQQLPPLRAFADAMRAVITGDASTLKPHFDIQASGNINHWQLALTPRDKTLQRFINRLEFKGELTRITEILSFETSGDRSEMTLTPR